RVGSRKPSSVSTSVVLPAPFGPSRPVMPPVPMERSTPFSARTSPYVFSSPWMSMLMQELVRPRAAAAQLAADEWSAATAERSSRVCRGSRASARGHRERVHLGGEHEVVPVESVDLVRPGLDAHPAPAHVQIGMVPLGLGELADAHRERHCAPEVGELE